MFGANVDDDFGVNLDTALANNNVGIGSDAITQRADNSGNTVWNDGYSLNNPLYDDTGKTVGNQTLYSTTADNFNNVKDVNLSNGLAGLKQFVNDNKSLIGMVGAGSALLSGSNSGINKTGYQGSIPQLTAGRTMITRPPTRAQGYRPGAGGIDYGGDVSYVRTPGLDPWAYLSGTSGTAAGANLTETPTNVVTKTDGSTVVNADGTVTKTDGSTVVTGDKNQVVTNDTWRKGLTPQQQYSVINQWILDHPNLTTKELTDALAYFKVSPTDFKAALAQNKTLSQSDVNALISGKGLKEINAQQTADINQWITDNPYATAQQIQDAVAGYGLNTTDIKEGLAGSKMSKAYQNALIGGMTDAKGGIPQLYENIVAFINDPKGHAPGEIARVAAEVGVSKADIDAAKAFVENKNEVKEFLGKTAGLTDKQIAAEMVKNNWSAAEVAAATGLSAKEVEDRKKAAGYAMGGMAKGRYLQGGTDGMADEIPARIGKDQPAALSHGEFVIPADVVSHMGNGNSDAGAKKLYQMMDKIRMARTGNKKQGKKINPDKFMPGGLAQAYASGGEVKHFQEGGATTANKNASMGISGIESNLSNWAGPYVTNMLGQGQALANMPYQAYMGPLTAGQSSLQNQGFTAASNLTTPSSLTTAAQTAGDVATTAKALPAYAPTTTSFDTTQATNYMNPYLQASLNPQLEEARRQSQITQQQNAAKMTQAGAFGGSRQAILDAETQRNLGTNLANITGTGYASAYDKAAQQFNADQQRKMQEAQYGAGYGLQGLKTGLEAAQTQGALGTQINQAGINNLNAMLTAGGQQRGIESEGIAADKAQFEEARANPYKMVQYQQSLLQGLPLAAQSYQGIEPTALVKAAQGATSVNGLLKALGLID
jgi:hypothetical protein